MNARTCVLVLLAASLTVLPASQAAAAARTKSVHASAAPVGSPVAAGNQFPAVALSYSSQYLAWIAPRSGKTQVMLSGWNGSHAHELAIPGDCSATGIRWAPHWNKLAVLTRCTTAASDHTRPSHSAVWVVDLNAGTPPHKIAKLDGLATCLQWTRPATQIAFLYAPGATRLPETSASCTPRGGAHGQRSKARWHVAVVPATGGRPKAMTPQSLDVYTYRLSPTGKRVAFTATAAANHGGHPIARLYVQDVHADATAAPEVIVDPAKAAGSLHDEWITQPRWSPARSRILFLAGKDGPRGLAGRDLYSVSLPGGSPVNLSALGGIKPTWFRYLGTNWLLVTRMVDGRTEVIRCTFTGGSIRALGTWFTVPGAIGNGREPLAVSLSAYVHQPVIAYAQQSPGPGYKVHSGVMHLAPPPVVATE